MTVQEALARLTEVDYEGKPQYPVGSVARTLAEEVERLRERVRIESEDAMSQHARANHYAARIDLLQKTAIHNNQGNSLVVTDDLMGNSDGPSIALMLRCYKRRIADQQYTIERRTAELAEWQQWAESHVSRLERERTELQAAVKRLTAELAEAKALASYQVAVDWRDKCRKAEVELAEIRQVCLWTPKQQTAEAAMSLSTIKEPEHGCTDRSGDS